MITISDQEKCVCIWGNCAYIDPNLLSEYKARGYAIVRLNNGSGNIRECLKAVVASASVI